jgi:hypothetical protein
MLSVVLPQPSPLTRTDSGSYRHGAQRSVEKATHLGLISVGATNEANPLAVTRDGCRGAPAPIQ